MIAKTPYLIRYTLLWIVLLTSCRHRMLYEGRRLHYIRIYIDEKIANTTDGFYRPNFVRPEYHFPHLMRVIVCEKHGGSLIEEQFLRTVHQDAQGRYFDGFLSLDAGSYLLLAYNYDTQRSVLKNEDNYFAIEAFTHHKEQHPSTKDTHLMPDDLFVAQSSQVEIKPCIAMDTVYNSSHQFFEARSCVKSYFLGCSVEGLEWVRSVSATLSGMRSNVRLHNTDLEEYPPTRIYFELNEHRDTLQQREMIYTTFQTFGKTHSDQHLVLDLDFELMGHRHQHERIDLGDLFSTSDALTHQWLILPHKIKIKEPQNGEGMNPDIDNWEDDQQEIII